MSAYPDQLGRKAGAEPDASRLVSAVTMSPIDIRYAWSRHRETEPAPQVDVCLVEDDLSIISLVRHLLKCDGMEVLAAETCRDAIAALRDTRPRLLLVDLGMPDRSGLEIARIVRGWCDYPRIPIVALTASAEKAGAAWRAGFTGFIPKPFVAKTFQVMVKSWVSAPTQ